jgi:hypothetical protein
MRVTGNPLIKGIFWLDDVQLAGVASAENNHSLKWRVVTRHERLHVLLRSVQGSVVSKSPPQEYLRTVTRCCRG